MPRDLEVNAINIYLIEEIIKKEPKIDADARSN